MTLTRRALYFAFSSGLSIATTFVMLPAVTNVLDPRDYGAYALVASYMALGSIVASAGIAYVFAAELPTASTADRSGLISSAFFLTVAVALCLGAGVWGLAVVLRSAHEVFRDLPGAALPLAATTLVLGAPWLVATDVLMLDGRAGAYSTLIALQTLTGAVATLTALYAADLDVLSLFVGAASAALVLFVGMIVVLRKDLRPVVHARWVRAIARAAPSALANNVAETIRTIVERTVLSTRLGLADLGVYAHAQQYRAYGIEAINPISRSLYPVALAEAREPKSTYDTTRRAWALAQVLVIGAGLTFALAGEEIVSVLTHGKFRPAGQLAVGWLVVLAVQTAGKPQASTLLAVGEGARLARLATLALALSLVVVVVAIPLWGMVGGVAAHGVQVVVLRVLTERAARRLRPVPFQDWWVVVGVSVVAGAYVLKQAVDPSPVATGLALVLSWAALAIAARGVLAPVAERALALLDRERLPLRRRHAGVLGAGDDTGANPPFGVS